MRLHPKKKKKISGFPEGLVTASVKYGFPTSAKMLTDPASIFGLCNFRSAIMDLAMDNNAAHQRITALNFDELCHFPVRNKVIAIPVRLVSTASPSAPDSSLGNPIIRMETESLFNDFATAAFFMFVVFSVSEMRYLLAIWMANRHINGERWNTMRRELPDLYSHFK